MALNTLFTNIITRKQEVNFKKNSTLNGYTKLAIRIKRKHCEA